MLLGGVPRVASSLWLAFLIAQLGSPSCCHKNGAPLLVDEGLGIIISLRASQSPSMTADKSNYPVPNTGKFCGGPLKAKVLRKGLSFQ